MTRTDAELAIKTVKNEIFMVKQVSAAGKMSWKTRDNKIKDWEFVIKVLRDFQAGLPDLQNDLFDNPDRGKRSDLNEQMRKTSI